MATTITTDNKWKPLKYGHEVPRKIMAEQFDHLSEEDGAYEGFIQYRGAWYHVSDFCTNAGFPDWHGFYADSYFSGVLIRLSNDGESYQIGTAIA